LAANALAVASHRIQPFPASTPGARLDRACADALIVVTRCMLSSHFRYQTTEKFDWFALGSLLKIHLAAQENMLAH